MSYWDRFWNRCFGHGDTKTDRSSKGGQSRLLKLEALEDRTVLSASNPIEQEGCGHAFICVVELISWQGQYAYVAPDRWIVTIDNLTGTTSEQFAAGKAMLQAANDPSLHVVCNLCENGSFLITSKMDYEELQHALSTIPGFECVEPDGLVLVDDPCFDRQDGLDNTGQTGGTIDADIDALQAWNLNTDTPNVFVGIIDTGIDSDHPDCDANMWVDPNEILGNGIDLSGYDLEGVGDSDPCDDHWLETPITGTDEGDGIRDWYDSADWSQEFEVPGTDLCAEVDFTLLQEE